MKVMEAIARMLTLEAITVGEQKRLNTLKSVTDLTFEDVRFVEHLFQLHLEPSMRSGCIDRDNGMRAFSGKTTMGG